MSRANSRASSSYVVSVFSIALAVCGALFFAQPLATPNLTAISAIQGEGRVSPFGGQTVTVEAVVTGDFQEKDELKGFFLQAPQGDGNPQTSEGIFVYVLMGNKLSSVDVAAGQRVRVTGTVKEVRGQTQINDPTEITILDAVVSNNVVSNKSTLVAPTAIQLPLAPGDDLERFEGMLVTVPGPLTVTGNYKLSEYGELHLSWGGRIYAPTNGNSQSAADSARRLIVLDDGSMAKNPNPVPYLDNSKTRRVGDTAESLQGVLGFAFGDFRLHPTQQPQFRTVNARPPAAKLAGTGVTVATFNVENYFTTLRSESKSARGAANAEEFARQSAKIVAALKVMDADIVGLIEIENNGDKAVSDLVAKLNAAYGAKTYSFVPDPAAGVGSDIIKCALIFKPARVQLVGEAVSDLKDVYSRTPVAQTFQTVAGAKWTVVVNHFKSKGSCPSSGDVDKGEGCWNTRRSLQAETLLQFIKQLQAESGDNDVLAVGDYNAYMEEEPIKVLAAGGLKVLNEMVPLAQRYSHQFQAHSGLLDYAFATPSMRAQVSDTTIWHINADEPKMESEDVNLPYRSSDHDPVIVALNLGKSTPATVAQR